MKVRSIVIPKLMVLLAVLPLGCSTVPQSTGLLEQEVHGAEISSAQLRSLLTEYVARFSGQVEQAADEVIARQPPPEIHRNALLLKSNGIAACFRAASRIDPMAGFVDLWILTIQMQRLLESTPPERQFGADQPEVIALARSLEFEIREVYDLIGEGVEPGERFAYEFAAAYPIADLYFVRESLSQHHIKGVAERPREMMDVVADMNRDLEELQRLSALYAEFLPKQAKWHAELMVLDAVNGPTFSQPFQDLATVTRAVTDIASTTHQAPALVHHEHLLLWENLRAERQASFMELERMRAQTTADISRERELVLAAVREERIAVSEQIDATVDRSLDRAESTLRERTDAMAYEGQFALNLVSKRALQGLGIIALFFLGMSLLKVLRQSMRSRTHPSVDPPHVVSYSPRRDPIEPSQQDSSLQQRRAA